MCGRYSLNVSSAELASYYEADTLGAKFMPRFNIAPQQSVPAVLDKERDLLQSIKWGLHPEWFKPVRGLINLKAETLLKKPFMRRYLSKRCLIPATGFYEWQKGPGGKVPYNFRLQERDLFSFAGVWETEKDARGTPVIDFAIITTAPNALVKEVHDRMPVILPREAEEGWLSAELDKELALGLLSPYPAEEMVSQPVSPKINNPKYDSPDILEK